MCPELSASSSLWSVRRQVRLLRRISLTSTSTSTCALGKPCLRQLTFIYIRLSKVAHGRAAGPEGRRGAESRRFRFKAGRKGRACWTPACGP